MKVSSMAGVLSKHKEREKVGLENTRERRKTGGGRKKKIKVKARVMSPS